MATTGAGGIFLSYRREETEHAAGRLADRMSERFGAAQVFMDIDSIPPGADFAAAVVQAVSGCDVLLALIGPKWTTVVDDDGTRRLDDPNDFVVREVHAALTRQIPVIPVLADGATMPRRSALPESLAELPHRNAVRIDAETFRSDVGALLDALATIMQTPTAARQSRSDSASGPPRPATGHSAGRQVDRRTALRLGAG